jgi:hypothetical protein
MNVTFTPTAPGSPTASLNIATNPALPLIRHADRYGNSDRTHRQPVLNEPGFCESGRGNAERSATVTLNACGNSLAFGASCTIGVFFDPTTGGTRTGTLTITDDGTGSTQTVALSGTGQDFSMAGASGSTTVSPGQTANFSVAVSPAGGFNQLVALNCSGGPALSTCAVSPSMVTLNGSAATMVTVAITTTAALPPQSAPFCQRRPPVGSSNHLALAAS